MNTERMNRLVTILQDVAATEKAFNLTAWAMNEVTECVDNKDFVQRHSETVGNAAVTCGTSACAMGYAALDSEFQAQGLKMHIEGFFNGADVEDDDWALGWVPVGSIRDFNELTRRPGASVSAVSIRFEGARGSHAAMEFFGITEASANWLFMPSAYAQGRPVSPAMVIDRIKQIMDLGGKCPAYEWD